MPSMCTLPYNYRDIYELQYICILYEHYRDMCNLCFEFELKGQAWVCLLCIEQLVCKLIQSPFSKCSTISVNTINSWSQLQY